MKRQLIERLNEGPVICAEGFLFEVEKRGYLAAGEFVPMVALEHPEALENLHKSIDIHHAGTAMRFLTAYLSTLDGGKFILTGSKRMKERPIGILVDALKNLGFNINYLKL